MAGEVPRGLSDAAERICFDASGNYASTSEAGSVSGRFVLKDAVTISLCTTNGLELEWQFDLLGDQLTLFRNSGKRLFYRRDNTMGKPGAE